MAEITPPPSQNNTPQRTFPAPSHPQGSEGSHASGLGADEVTVPPLASALSPPGASAGAEIPEGASNTAAPSGPVPAGDSMDLDNIPSPGSVGYDELLESDPEALMEEPEAAWDGEGEGEVEVDPQEIDIDSESEEEKGKGKGKARATATKKRTKRATRRLPQQHQPSYPSRTRPDRTDRLDLKYESGKGGGGRKDEQYESEIVQRWNTQFGDVLGPAPKRDISPAPAKAPEPEPEVAPAAPSAPVEPVQPAELTQPTEPAEPTEPTEGEQITAEPSAPESAPAA
ncbi:hypothetical protein L198_00645 [Cryptococcus wingfieldii CBS 7118]|uniref:Uncharacterized protein n=1 Tax=Cryptococcus wingfieldii CBS 7118 TaxID=1295528 RepID=A0A1E3K7K8_9TREE|nr:hypothetical protein L198_00645 [Cryptococcus wingfieldii CBS 7118]ODO08906.1 hypothetical protein L198_00645 [Cryptococcus wingfieldii CBS 7118]